MLIICCAKCRKPLDEPGGVAFAPPEHIEDRDNEEYAQSFHICPPCWGYFLRWLYHKGEPVFPLPPVYVPLPIPQDDRSWPPGHCPYEITCAAGCPPGGSLTPR